MEHRMKYRDIPWGVALTVLPGKIIGQFILNPIGYIMHHWQRILNKILKMMCVTVLLFMASTVLFLLVDTITGGNLPTFLSEIYKNVLELLS